MTDRDALREKIAGLLSGLLLDEGNRWLTTDALLALIEPLVGAALTELAEMFHDLSENKRLAEMEEWVRTARRYRDQGDMYGWNFYEGMRAGANATDILYQRLGRLIRNKCAALAQEEK